MGLYRTTVTVRGVYDLDRLRSAGAQIVAVGHASATVVVDRNQLELLARWQLRPSHTAVVSELENSKGADIPTSAN